MPLFYLHLHRRMGVERAEDALDFADLQQAYLEVIRAIPDIARDLLAAGEDAMNCTYVIHDEHGHRLMEVPFTKVFSPEARRAIQPRHQPR